MHILLKRFRLYERNSLFLNESICFLFILIRYQRHVVHIYNRMEKPFERNFCILRIFLSYDIVKAAVSKYSKTKEIKDGKDEIKKVTFSLLSFHLFVLLHHRKTLANGNEFCFCFVLQTFFTLIRLH